MSIKFKMKNTLQNNQNGFSLTEMMVTVMIFSIVIAGIYSTLAASESSWFVNSTQTELQQDLRIAMSRIKDDLVQSGTSAIANVSVNVEADLITYPDPELDPAYNWSTTITFQKTAGVSGSKILWDTNSIQFVLSGTDLQRIEGSATQVIAQNISSFQVRRMYETPDIVEAQLTVQSVTPRIGTLSDTLAFKVYLRN